MSDNSLVKNNYVCFALPEGFSTSAPVESVQDELSETQKKVNINHDDLLSGLNTRGIEVMSRFVPTLMCGEESATHVFQKEAHRIKSIHELEASSSLMEQIAREEAVHEWLLSLLRNQLPVPDDFDALRRRARYFFFRLASREPVIHFSRIVGLDSGVCITLSSLLSPTSMLTKSPQAYKIWERIWKDESRHVKISRQHVLDMGIDKTKMMEEGMCARKGLAELLQPLGDDFEAIGVDPDRLFRRIMGNEEV